MPVNAANLHQALSAILGQLAVLEERVDRVEMIADEHARTVVGMPAPLPKKPRVRDQLAGLEAQLTDALGA